MKKIIVFLIFFNPLIGSAQPSSAQYLIEEVFKFEIVKERDYYRIDSSFLFELIERAYPNNWYTPIKRNLDIYAYQLLGSYKPFLSEAYERNNLAIGSGHFFDNQGKKKAFTIIFVLDETKKNYSYIHFCQSKDDTKPVWQFIEISKLRCINARHSEIPIKKNKEFF